MVRIKVFPKSKQNSTSASNGGGYYTSSGGGLKSTKGVYLWGQYHDHTADIDGDITSKGNVTANGVNAITVSASSASVESLSASSANAVSFSASSASVETFSGKDATIESLSAETISSSTINNSGLINTNQIKAVSGYIQTLLGENWTVDNLTVTKAAHFFKLIIDEIKASQGAIIITPANCVLDHVEKLSNGDYRCYFLNKDDEKEIYNNFEVNDQVICQTLNAATGTSYNVSNTYYWRLCTQTGTTGDYHYIDLSDTDKDRYSNSAPSAGDNCVLLGNRSDSSRQAAIIISAYNSGYLDKGIVAPSICQYEGINDYDLTTHRMNVLSKGLNSFKGTFITSTGDNIEDLLDKELSGVTTYLHVAYAMSEDGSSGFSKTYFNGALYIGMCSNLNKDDSSLVYSDYTWARIKGEDGESVNVDKWDVLYATSTSSTQPDDSAFVYPMPELEEGVFLWTLTRITYSDGTVIKSYSVSRIGSDGKEGTPGAQGPSGLTSYIHLAYANSADGSQGFSVTYFDDAKYIGTYTDYTKEDSTNYRDYEWKVLRGNDGKDITIVRTEILYAQTSTQYQPSEDSFSSTMPDAIAGYYMWTLTRITYSDGTVTRAYSCTKNGNNGQSGATGADGEMYKLVPIRELAIVDKNGTLGVQLEYNIVHIKGNTAETITSSSSGYHITFNPNHTSTYYILSTGTTYPSYTSTGFMYNYHKTSYKPTYLSVYLYNRGGSPLDRRTVTVTFDAGATLQVTDNITATVTANKQETDGKISANTTNIAALSATAESITSKIEANTTKINSVSGTVESTKNDISKLQQTASGLTSTVESHTTQIGDHTNQIGGLKGQTQYLDSQVSSLNQTASGLTSTVQRMEKTLSDNSTSISEIRQTADDITLSVNDLSVRLDNTKFEINADTVVNGSLTLTDDNQGFILKGSSGTTEIAPKSVGKWANWSEKTTIPVETNAKIPLDITQSGNLLYAFGEINVNLGPVAAYKYISVSTPCAYVVNANGKIVDPYNVTLFRIRLYREGSTSPVTTFTASTTCHAGIVINYYTSSYYWNSYTLKIEYNVRFAKEDLPNKVGTLMYSGIVNLPTDGYAILGYDGLGMSFGGSSYFFSNYEGTWMKYGNYGLAVQNSGIFLYNSSKGVWSLWDGSSGESGANVGCKYISVNGSNYSVDANGFINLPNYPQKVVSAVTLNGTTYAASNSASTVSLPNVATSAVVNGYTINPTKAGVLGLGSLVRTIIFNKYSYTPTEEGTITLPTTVTAMTVNGSTYSPNTYGTLSFPTVVTSITNGSTTVTPNTEGTVNISSLLSVSGNFLRTDTTEEQTIQGDLWLKNVTYGNKIIFGDKFNLGSYTKPRVYVGEPEDDKLTLYGMSGVTMSGSTDKIYATNKVDISGTSGVNVTTKAGFSINLNDSFKVYPDKFSTGAYAYTHYDSKHMYLRMTNGTYVVSTALDIYGGIGFINSDKYSIYTDHWNTLYVKPTYADMEKTSSISYAAYFRGNGYITGSWTQASDERFKDKIEDKEYAVEDFANAPLFSFTWTPEPEPLEFEDDDSEVKACNNTVDTDEHVGTTAQYWKDKIPELVSGSDEDRYGIDYSTLGTVGAITNAREIVKLKQENQELKARLAALEDIVSKLSANS